MFDKERTQNKNVLSLFFGILVSIRDNKPLPCWVWHWVNLCLDKMSLRLSAWDNPSSSVLLPNGLLIMALSQKQEPNGKDKMIPGEENILISNNKNKFKNN